MLIKFFITGNLLLVLGFFAAVSTNAQASPRRFSEPLVIRSMRQLHSAQATFQAAYGNGNFGSLQDLLQSQFIDPVLASGSKYGYIYVVTVVPYSPPSTPSSFTITATPRAYRKTGSRSFFINEYGLIRGADRNGLPATADDPVIDDCTNGSIDENERCTIGDMRLLFNAEMTFASTAGNGQYGSLRNLYEAGLIRPDLADYLSRGYSYWVATDATDLPERSASFMIRATPETYRVSAIRSFFIDQTGVLRGADKNGQPADADDPPIDNQSFKD